MNLPADVANQALDAIGWPVVIGSLEEGSREAQVLLRAYSQCKRQLLRAAHWNFARKQAPMILLADVTGGSPNVGTIVPAPWIYSYALPEDCMKARFVPWSWPSSNGAGAPAGNIQPPNSAAPLVGGLSSAPWAGARLRPARFVDGLDVNDPPPSGTGEANGVSQQGRSAIFTNVQYAILVYTAQMDYPANWDSQFRAALVAYIASEIALPLWIEKDRKFGLQLRTQQIALAAAKITAARATDGNEGFYTTDASTDWITFRRSGGAGFNRSGDQFSGGGPGMFYAGCDSCCGVGETSAY